MPCAWFQVRGGHIKKSGVGCTHNEHHVEEVDMKFERVRRTVVLTVVIALLGVGILRPRPAHAVETAIIVVGSIAAYVAVVVAGTMLMRRNTPAEWGLMPMDQRLRDDRPEPGVDFAHRCKQDSSNLTLVCW